VGIAFAPQETGEDFCENALLKARELKKLIEVGADGVIADDSGLCVDALDGRPGVFSARYGDGGEKRLTSGEKNLLLLDEMNGVKNRSAHFVCTMVLLFDNDRFFIAQETLAGEIVESRRSLKGSGGFGFDPVFFVPSHGRTLAELSADEKNTISHRGKAGRQIALMLKNFL
jgi:XTP/dITP diphosphohydrolase